MPSQKNAAPVQNPAVVEPAAEPQPLIFFQNNSAMDERVNMFFRIYNSTFLNKKGSLSSALNQQSEAPFDADSALAARTAEAKWLAVRQAMLAGLNASNSGGNNEATCWHNFTRITNRYMHDAYDDVLASLRQAHGNNNAEIIWKQAIEHLRKGEYAQAEAIFERYNTHFDARTRENWNLYQKCATLLKQCSLIQSVESTYINLTRGLKRYNAIVDVEAEQLARSYLSHQIASTAMLQEKIDYYQKDIDKCNQMLNGDGGKKYKDVYEAEILSLGERLRDIASDNEIERLRKQRDSSLAVRTEADAVVRNLNEEKKSLEQELEEAKQKKAAWEKQLEEAKQKYEQLQGEVQKAQKDYTLAKISNQSVIEQKEAAKATIHRLMGYEDHVAEHKKNMQRQFQELNTHSAIMQDYIKQVRALCGEDNPDKVAEDGKLIADNQTLVNLIEKQPDNINYRNLQVYRLRVAMEQQARKSIEALFGKERARKEEIPAFFGLNSPRGLFNWNSTLAGNLHSEINDILAQYALSEEDLRNFKCKSEQEYADKLKELDGKISEYTQIVADAINKNDIENLNTYSDVLNYTNISRGLIEEDHKKFQAATRDHTILSALRDNFTILQTMDTPLQATEENLQSKTDAMKEAKKELEQMQKSTTASSFEASILNLGNRIFAVEGKIADAKADQQAADAKYNEDAKAFEDILRDRNYCIDKIEEYKKNLENIAQTERKKADLQAAQKPFNILMANTEKYRANCEVAMRDGLRALGNLSSSMNDYNLSPDFPYTTGSIYKDVKDNLDYILMASCVGKERGHTNTEEYQQMINACTSFYTTNPSDTQNLQEALAEIKRNAENYIDKKKNQSFASLRHSEMRKARLSMAENLIQMCDTINVVLNWKADKHAEMETLREETIKNIPGLDDTHKEPTKFPSAFAFAKIDAKMPAAEKARAMKLNNLNVRPAKVKENVNQKDQPVNAGPFNI